MSSLRFWKAKFVIITTYTPALNVLAIKCFSYRVCHIQLVKILYLHSKTKLNGKNVFCTIFVDSFCFVFFLQPHNTPPGVSFLKRCTTMGELFFPQHPIGTARKPMGGGGTNQNVIWRVRRWGRERERERRPGPGPPDIDIDYSLCKWPRPGLCQRQFIGIIFLGAKCGEKKCCLRCWDK